MDGLSDLRMVGSPQMMTHYWDSLHDSHILGYCMFWPSFDSYRIYRKKQHINRLMSWYSHKKLKMQQVAAMYIIYIQYWQLPWHNCLYFFDNWIQFIVLEMLLMPFSPWCVCVQSMLILMVPWKLTVCKFLQ